VGFLGGWVAFALTTWVGGFETRPDGRNVFCADDKCLETVMPTTKHLGIPLLAGLLHNRHKD
jgi:hypothetical protein